MQGRRLTVIATLALLVGCLVPQGAQAEPVRLDFEIDVRQVFGNLQEVFGVPIAIGDVVKASLTYDSSTLDLSPGALEGHYRSVGSIAFGGGAGLTLPLESLWVFDETFDPRPQFDDVFAAFAFTDSWPGFDSLQAELYFRGGGRTGDALPVGAAEILAAFGSGGGLRFTGWKTGGSPPFDSGTHELGGTVRVLPDVPQPVPEPGSLLLFASGAAALVRRYRQSRRITQP